MIKAVIAEQLAEAMKAKHISRQAMAKRMATSRAQLARLFDPENDRVQLDTIQKAAAVLGMRVTIKFEDVASIEPSPLRGRPPVDLYLMWLCYHMACEVDEETEFLPQHNDGGYKVVGDKLGLSPEAVVRHVRKAQKRRDTEDGLREYCEWRERREKQWWLYHAACVENRELHLTSKEVVRKAQKRLKDEGARAEEDYKHWLAFYKRRDKRVQRAPLRYRPLSSDDPAAIAMDENRRAKGLRTGLTKAGRKRAH
jgi:transcriptional regulator with XRE-family HTH domain